MAADPKLSWAGVAAMMSGPGLGPALNSGYLRVYDNTGAVPANCDDSNGSNVLLAELAFGATAFGTCDGAGKITANAITPDSSANASGTAAYGRYYKSDGTTAIFQGTCGLANADFILNDLAIESAAEVSCTSATLSGVRE